MAIARIEGGQIVDERPISLTDVPDHKRAAWLPLEGEPPVVDRALYVVTGPAYTIEPTRVLQTWTVTPRPATIADVKREAQRRIITITGAADLLAAMIKQLNANMRANELNDKRLSGEVLTADEAAEASGLRALATTIKAVRTASNAIETELPATFAEMAADPRWP